MDWRSACVLVTGGTGSFGRMFARVALDELHPRKLIVYSRDEWKQHEMRAAGFTHANLRYFIGDVRDAERLRRAMHGVDVVVHAAALKQVPACEYNPIEAVQTNINGTRNVIDAAIDCGVGRALALSTDKATAPVNIYGATKLVAEKLFVHANAYSALDETIFSCVRYGNVLGSRGSVLPLFEAQRRAGRLTITDPRMTRFWITLEQGVRFTVSCIEQMRGGEVFIPKLPSMRVVDLARTVAPDAPLEFIGVRAGEKLHEMMLSTDEARSAVELNDRFVIFPGDREEVAHAWQAEGTRPRDGFCYSSETNDVWLTTGQMREWIDAALCAV